MQKQVLFALLIFYSCFFNCFSQQTHKHKLGFISDNDLYVSTTLDRYYTNGLHIFYQEAEDTKIALFSKKIKQFTLGQNIYNPFNPNVPNVFFQDRPYAGYVFGSYAETFVNAKNILSLGLEIGYTGPNTGAKIAQNFIHDIYGIEKSEGWNSQVKQRFNIGVIAKYEKFLAGTENQKTDLFWHNQANIGNLISSLESGIHLRLAFVNEVLTSIAQSVFYETDLTPEDKPWIKECFLGIKSNIKYQLADETITGELQENSILKEFKLVSWIWHNDIGLYWNLRNWNISYHQIFHTRNVKTIASEWVRYGSIQVAYKF